MVQEAKQYEEEDKKRKELVELKNKADGLIYSTEQSLKEHGDKIDQDKKGQIEEAIQTLKKSLEGENFDEINTNFGILTTLSMSIGEGMYKPSGDEGNAEENKEEDKSKDNVVDID